MKNENKLFMVMLGCRPQGRFTEQHDIFFGIGKTLKELIPNMKKFWPEAKGRIHIDAWREVTQVENYTIKVVLKESINTKSDSKLFFVNLGGYKPNEFEEYHYKVLAVGENMRQATKKAKETTFYKHTTFEGATSHIDDKYGIDIDDCFNVKEILSKEFTSIYELEISSSKTIKEDLLHIGYLKIDTLKDE